LLAGAEAQPAIDRELDGRELRRTENAEPADELGVGDSYKSLGVKRARLKERCWNSDLEPGPAYGRGVRNERYERAIDIGSRDAEDEGRTNLCDEAEVH
jgi:hypothetical protein